MAVVCQQCGRRNPAGEQFCTDPDCGAYLGWEGGSTVVGKAAPPATRSDPGSGGASGMTGLTGIGGTAVVSLAEPDLSVVPGESVTTTASVHNGGTRVEQFTVTVAGPTAGWASVEPATMPVYPGEQAQCTIRFAPPRHSSTTPGRAWYTVRAFSPGLAGQAAEAHGQVEVGQFRELAAVLHPQHTTGRLRTRQEVELTNHGNVLEPVSIEGRDQTGKLRFAVPGQEFTVGQGSQRVRVGVRAPVRLLGQRRSFPYHLTVTPRPPTQPIRLDGAREAVPLIAGWFAKLTALVAVLVLVGGAAVWAATQTGSAGGTESVAATGAPVQPTTPPAPNTPPPTTPPAPTQPPTPPAQLAFVDRVAGSWVLQSWVEAGGPTVLGIEVLGGQLQIAGTDQSNQGQAGWRLDIQPTNQPTSPQAAIGCGGVASLSEQIEGVPGGELNRNIDWTPDLETINSSATGEDFIRLALCGFATIGTRAPFTVVTDGDATTPATLLEMRNDRGTLRWSRG